MRGGWVKGGGGGGGWVGGLGVRGGWAGGVDCDGTCFDCTVPAAQSLQLSWPATSWWRPAAHGVHAARPSAFE